MRTKIINLVIFLWVMTSYSQVGVNTTNPKALLDIEVEDRVNPTPTDGLLLPRVSTLPTGTNYLFNMVTFYNTTDHTFYYWDGVYNVWKKITGIDTNRIIDLSDASTTTGSVFLGNSAGNYVGYETFSTAIGYYSVNPIEGFQVGIGWQAGSTRSKKTITIGYDAFSQGSPMNGTNVPENLVSIGYKSLYYSPLSTSSAYNPQFYGTTAIGSLAVNNFGDLGIRVSAVGYAAIKKLKITDQVFDVTGFGSRAIGFTTNGIGSKNVAFGSLSFANLDTTGEFNVAFGSGAGYNLISGIQNAACGSGALENLISGNRNTAIGTNALQNLPLNSGYNTAVGAGSNPVNSILNGTITIGDSSVATADEQARFGDAGVSSIGGFVNWSNLSDKRFKKEIKENVPGIKFITKLRPVSYQLDLDALALFLKTPLSNRKPLSEKRKQEEVQTGFIAQEVEEVANEVNFDFNGVRKPKNKNDFYGLRYASFVVPLTKAIQEQQDILKQQKEQIAKLKQKIAVLDKLLNEADELINFKTKL